MEKKNHIVLVDIHVEYKQTEAGKYQTCIIEYLSEWAFQGFIHTPEFKLFEQRFHLLWECTMYVMYKEKYIWQKKVK